MSRRREAQRVQSVIRIAKKTAMSRDTAVFREGLVEKKRVPAQMACAGWA
jgi:hypothetical protein